MSFVQSTYFVNESKESVEVELTLSDSSSIDVLINITNFDTTANGKYVTRPFIFQISLSVELGWAGLGWAGLGCAGHGRLTKLAQVTKSYLLLNIIATPNRFIILTDSVMTI